MTNKSFLVFDREENDHFLLTTNQEGQLIDNFGSPHVIDLSRYFYREVKFNAKSFKQVKEQTPKWRKDKILLCEDHETSEIYVLKASGNSNLWTQQYAFDISDLPENDSWVEVKKLEGYYVC